MSVEDEVVLSVVGLTSEQYQVALDYWRGLGFDERKRLMDEFYEEEHNNPDGFVYHSIFEWVYKTKLLGEEKELMKKND